MRSHYCGDVNESLIEQTVKVAGWMHRRRDHGWEVSLMIFVLNNCISHHTSFVLAVISSDFFKIHM